jgi:hypothetical protein
VSPDNVHETGVWPGGQSGSPIVAAEAEQVERLAERPGHGPDPRFLCPTGPQLHHEAIRVILQGRERVWVSGRGTQQVS